MNNSDLETATDLVDFNHPDIQKLIEDRNWRSMSTYDAVGAAYDFVRNEIKFGYHGVDGIPAHQVLQDGFGQCNTKGILLMALLRGIAVPCRIRGLTISKILQRGIMPEFIFPLVPDNILHSWVEVFLDGKWISLEGFILDDEYLSKIQQFFGSPNKAYCGYGVGTRDLMKPTVDWIGESTFIQCTGINQDFGVFSSPDELFSKHVQDFPWWKALVYENVVRHWMNFRLQKVRDGRRPQPLSTDRYTSSTPDTLKLALIGMIKQN